MTRAARTWKRFSPRRRLLVGLTALALAAMGAAAWAFWTASANTGGSGAATAASVNQGATPTATPVAGRKIDVNWGASTLTNGHAVDGYIVKRYPAAGGSAVNVSNGTCDGTVTTTSCTETLVPAGSWQYTVTPVIGTTWQGTESLHSGTATVAAATISLAKILFAATLPQNTTGSLAAFAADENVTYRLDAATALTGAPTSVDATGAATITSLTIPSAADGAHTVFALGTGPTNPSQASIGIVIDQTAPTVGSQVTPSPNAAGWNNASPMSVALSADDGTGSGISHIYYTTDGSTPTTSSTIYTSPISVSTNNTTIKFFATDVAGNASGVQSTLVKIDTVAPTNNITLNPLSGNSLLSGSTVFYRGNATGSFTLTNAVADALSGPASSATAALADTSTGFSHTSTLVSTPSGGPYVSSAFSWSAGTSSSPTETVTGRDGADNATSATLAFTNDSTGPTGGSVDATGLLGTGSRYSTSTTLSISFSQGIDAGVGLAATGAQLLRAQANLTSSDGATNGTCGTYGSFSQVGSNDPASPVTDNSAGISSGHCYQYEYVVADKLGNSTTYTSPDIKVDTTAPTGPSSATITPATGPANQFVSGSQVYYNPAQSGSFNVDSSASDPNSGISQVVFPPFGASNFTGGGTVTTPTTGTTFRTTYSWSSGATTSGGQSVSATDNASLISNNNAAFTITPDSTAPAGGALTTNSIAATGAGSTSVNGTGSFSISRTDYTDSGSGLASSTLTRDTGTLASSDGIAAATCTGFGSTTTLTGAPAQSGLGSGCYRYTLTGTDKVGNSVSVSTTVKVDTTDPSAPTVAVSNATGGKSFISGSTVYTNPQTGNSGAFDVSATSTDSQSGIDHVNFPTLTGFTSGGGNDSSTPYSTTYSWSGSGATASGSQTVTSFNGVLRTATGSFTVTPDTTAPTGGALVVSGATNGFNSSGSFSIARTDYTEALSASQSGLQSSVLARQVGTLSSSDGIAAGTCSSFGTASTVTGSVSESGDATGCYLYTLTGTDKVGNAATVTTTVKVDRTGPSIPTVSVSGATGSSTFISGSTVFINNVAGKTGTFQVSATSTDSDSGILKMTFPTLAGFTGGGDVTTSLYSTTYSWSGAVTAAGAQSVSATHNAGLSATKASAFTVTSDTAAPSGGSISYTNGFVTSLSVPVTASAGTDGAGSGIATTTIQRDQVATQADGTCGTFPGTFATTVTLSGGNDTSVSSNTCYKYRYVVTDNVGNQVAYTSTSVAQVDTAAPAPTDVVLAGAAPGQATLGDTLTATYSERLDATTFCSTWNNTGTGTQSIAGSGAVTVTIANTGTNDTLTITAVGSSCGGTGNFKFGSVALGGNYVNADTTYSGSGGSKSTLTWDPVAHTLAIMLGTPSAAGNTGIAAGTPTYTPSAALKDLAGNTISASAFTASGTSRF